jgi:hypothetical protein
MDQQVRKNHVALGSRAFGYHRQRERRHHSQNSSKLANTKHLKVSFPRPHKVNGTETSRGATRKMKQHDNRDERAQTTHQKQQEHPKNYQKGSSGNQPTQNRLLQSDTRSDHEPRTQTRMPLLWSTIDDLPHPMAMERNQRKSGRGSHGSNIYVLCIWWWLPKNC